MQEVCEEVPDAWHIIVADLDCHAPKQKVTLYLDAPVAKAFKAMGQGYQARINRILATYLEMKGGICWRQKRSC
ncbi:MAG: BrnA antitoxin family protein [Ascidiaceihabitans sp.]